MASSNSRSFCGRTRREFLWQAGAGFTGVALAEMLGRDGFLARQTVAADNTTPYANPLAPRNSQLMPKAKRVIFLFMYGGPSHLDTFDYKPAMDNLDGKTVAVETARETTRTHASAGLENFRRFPILLGHFFYVIC